MLRAQKIVFTLLVAAVIAILAGAAYWAYASYQTRSQQRAIAQRVEETTAQLRQGLSGSPTTDGLKSIEATLEGLRATSRSRQKPLADAAEDYALSARAIVQRRAELARAVHQAAASRETLIAHMAAPRGRDDGWIRQAAALKKRADEAQFQLNVASDTLIELLARLIEPEERLAAKLGSGLLLEDGARQAALKRAQDDARLAAGELEKLHRLPAR